MAKTNTDSEEAAGPSIALPLERLARLMRAGEYEYGLNPAQWEALRYLSRANRFSNSPGALTRYLGATKGTISQTVKALERKGYVVKAARLGEKRSITLVLTTKGEEALNRDPWSRLSTAVGNLGGKTRRRMLKGLRELLTVELKRGNHQSFGFCSTCRYFSEGERKGDPLGPHLCKLLNEPLSTPDATRICAEHEDRTA